MISFFAGRIGDGAFWQSSIFLFGFSSFLMQSSFASGSLPAVVVAVGFSCAVATPLVRKTAPAASNSATSSFRMRIEGLLTRDDEGEDEAEERERLGERDTEEHGRTDHAGRLRLARHRRDGVADDEPDADAGADGGAAVDDATADRGESGRDVRGGGLC